MAATACPSCEATNPESSRYCGDCGAPLATPKLPPDIADAIKHAVSNELRLLLKDKEVVEIKVATAIAERLMGWAKTYALVVGSLVAVAGLILTVTGVSSYSQLRNKVAAAVSTVDTKVAATSSDLARIEHESAKLGAQLAARREQLASLDQLEPRLARLENVFFEQSPALTPELRQNLQSALDGFRQHVASVGFAASTPVTVSIDAKDVVAAHYLIDKRKIVVGSASAKDRDVVFREYMHGLLTDARQLTTNETDLEALALSSALADYFACSYLDDPVTGVHVAMELRRRHALNRAFIRNLDNDKMAVAVGSLDYHAAGEVWGGAFWTLRKVAAPAIVDRLLFRAWQNVPPDINGSTLRSEFVAAVERADRELFRGQHAATIRATFRSRGFV